MQHPLKSISTNKTISPTYDIEDSVVVNDDDGYYHTDISGKELYKARFDYCRNFKNNRAVVLLDGEYFHITNKGKQFYKDRFSYVSDFYNQVSIVRNKVDSLFTHINTSGHYLYNRWYAEVDVFVEGYARVSDENGWFHIDTEGKPSYCERFLEVSNLINDQARVTDKYGDSYIITSRGEIVHSLKNGNRDNFGDASAITVSYWKTQVVKSAVDLKLFQYLPCTINDLTKKIKIKPDILKRFLRALKETSLVFEKDNIYHLTEISQYMHLKHPLSLVPAIQHWAQENYIAWMGLTNSLQSGESSYRDFHDAPIFEWLDKDIDTLEQYHNAIKTYAEYDYPELINQLDLSSAHIVIDAAGGYGVILMHLLKKIPNIHGYLLERQQVVETVKIPSNLKKRLKVKAFDLFKTWQVKGDVIFLSRILHDWSDLKCKQILENAYKALNVGGRVIVIEMLLPENNSDGGLLDLNMLVITGGKERTLAEIKKLMDSVGFVYSEIFHHRKLSAVEFIKV